MRLKNLRMTTRAVLAAVCMLPMLAACSGVGKDDSTFLIGGFGALSGPVAGWGEAQRNGAELAVKEINASDELNMKLKLTYEDDACDPAGVQSIFRRLVDRENVDILYGGACSPSALAMADLAEDGGVPYLSPLASNPAMINPPRKFVFSTQVDDASAARELVRMALETYSPKRVAFMYTANDYGIGAVDGAKAALKEQAPNVEIVAEAGFPEGTSEFDSGLIKLRDAHPDVVFAAGIGSDLGPMIRASRQVGVDAELVGFSSLFTSETIRTAGDLLDNVTGFFYTPVRVASDSDDKVVADLAKNYKAAFGEWPDGIALQGYEGIKVLAEAIKNLDGDEPTPENMVKALEGIKNFDLHTRMPITFGPGDRQGTDKGVLMKLLPGRAEKTSLWGNFEIVKAG